MHFFCFYFGYFEVTTHQILLIMVIMLFCPTLRQHGASFCGCSLHFNFIARGSHYMSLWSFDILLHFFEFMPVFCDHIMVLCANFTLYLWIIYVPLWSFYVFLLFNSNHFWCSLSVCLWGNSVVVYFYCDHFVVIFFLSLWPFCFYQCLLRVFAALLLVDPFTNQSKINTLPS